MTEQILNKMDELINTPMTYKKLCEYFGEPYYTGGNKKTAQIKEWQLFCDLEITSKPTRYIIHAVHHDNLETYEIMSRQYHMQPLFNAILYEWIKSNKYKTIYASYTEILKALFIVNENFPYMMDKRNMKLLGKEYEIYPEIAQTAYTVLKGWARRILSKASQYATIIVRYAFRLNRICYDEEGNAYRRKITDVPIDSELEKKCQAIYSQAAQEVMPANWGILDNQVRTWVSNEDHKKFEERVKQLLQDKFHGEVDEMVVIRAICPAEQNWIDKELEDIYKNQLPKIQINAESCRKIFSTTQFDKIDDNGYLCTLPNITKRKFIDLGIKIPPEIQIKEILDEIREAKKNK